MKMSEYNYISTPTQGTTINYVSSYTDEQVLKDIESNESRDRYVAARMIYDSFKEGVSNITLTPTDIKCAVDLKCSCTVPLPEYTSSTTCNFNVEIKERYKDEENLKKYPDVELKVSKYQRMKRESQGKFLFYIVLLNEKTGYIFDLTDINKIQGLQTFNWTIKKTQLDPNSGYETVPTYLIPTSNAVRKIDITQYYRDYYNANYTETKEEI